ncbi:hypothetical protein D9M71_767780 [compost metagenome]
MLVFRLEPLVVVDLPLHVENDRLDHLYRVVQRAVILQADQAHDAGGDADQQPAGHGYDLHRLEAEVLYGRRNGSEDQHEDGQPDFDEPDLPPFAELQLAFLEDIVEVGQGDAVVQGIGTGKVAHG